MTSAVKRHDVTWLDLGHNSPHCLAVAFPMSNLIIHNINRLKNRLMLNVIRQQ